MNLDKIDGNITRQEVYSNELNEILSKTPPRLFKIMLLAIGFGGGLIFSVLYFTKYNQTVSENSILMNHPSTHFTILIDSFAASKLLQAETIQYAERKQGKVKSVRIDSIFKEVIYQISDSNFVRAEQLNKMDLDLHKIRPFTRAEFYFNSDSAIETEGLYNVRYFIGKRRLISRYFKGIK